MRCGRIIKKISSCIIYFCNVQVLNNDQEKRNKVQIQDSNDISGNLLYFVINYLDIEISDNTQFV